MAEASRRSSRLPAAETAMVTGTLMENGVEIDTQTETEAEIGTPTETEGEIGTDTQTGLASSRIFRWAIR